MNSQKISQYNRENPSKNVITPQILPTIIIIFNKCKFSKEGGGIKI